jgi:hypothetical protein
MSGWNGWASLGGQLAASGTAVGQNLDGRLELFGAVSGGAPGPELAHIWQTSPNGGWSAWSNLGAPVAQFLGFPTVGRNADGRLEVFARVGLMSSGELWHTWQTAPSGWSAWSNLGGDVGAHVLAVGQNQDDRQEVFAITSVGTLQHIWQTTPNGGWSAWADLGSPSVASLTSVLTVGQNLDGRLEVFTITADGALWHLWQTTPNGAWSGWDVLGAPPGLTLGELAVARNQDGRLEVFAITSGALWHRWQMTPGGSWDAWSSLSTPPGVTSLGSPAVGHNADGRLEVMVTGSNDAIWHIWQTSAGGAWSGWESLGGESRGGLAIGQNADGRLEVFSTEDNAALSDAVWHRWQTSPNGGWVFVSVDWQSLGPADSIKSIAISSAGLLLAGGATGVWQSVDRGASWTKASASLVGSTISFAPASSPIWAVSGDGKQILTSLDGGTTWIARYTTTGQIIAVLADPNTTGTIWAGLSAADTLAEVLRSTDGGSTWVPVLPASLRGGGAPSPMNAGPLAALPGTVGFVVAGVRYYHSGGVLQTTDAGASWTLAYPDTYTLLAGASAVAAGGASAATATIYAGLNVLQFGSLVRSDDGGTTWIDLSQGLPLQGPGTGGYVANITLQSGQPGVVYISQWDTSSPERTGVFVSVDRGQTWTEVGHLALQVAGPGGLVLDGSTNRLYAATTSGVYCYPL